MQLMAKLRQAGVKVSIQDMIQSKTLSELAARASNASAPEVSSFDVTFDMEKFNTQTLPRLGLAADAIEAAMGIGPMQKGILLSAQRQAASYELRIVCEIGKTLDDIDSSRLQTAWHRVVQRHSSLRTIFVESILEDAPCDQVVLRSAKTYTSVVECNNLAEVQQLVRNHKIIATANQPQANFIIYRTPDSTYCMVDANHAMIDGVSVLLLFQDLSTAYSGLLSHDTRSFSHYIGYLQQQDEHATLEYWKRYLADLNPCHFPILNDDYRGMSELHEVSTVFDSATQLQDFCRKYSFTPSSVMQAAWAIVLRCYTGQSDVCFGYLSAGRDAPIVDIEDTIGTYINMLVCRLQLQPNSHARDVVISVQDAFLNAMPHQTCSLGSIQHEIGVKEPMFNTIMSLQSAIGETIHGQDKNGIFFTIVDEVDPTEYDISVNIAISREVCHLNLRHYTSKLSDKMAYNVLETFQHTIRTLISSPEARFGDLSLLSGHDQTQLRKWNSADWQDYKVCVHDQISQQVSQRPDTTAIEAWDGSLTYRQLERLSSTLASYLSSIGVGPEVLVPIAFTKSMWTPVAQLAVLKAGGACVAFDPAHPHKRRAELVRQCDARIAVTAPAYKALFDGLVDNIVVVEPELLQNISQDTSLQSTSKVTSPHNPAFVVFTSGSTGVPKGIVLEHHALCTSARAHGPAINYGPGARILQFASYTFDVSIGETFTCLMLGGTLCIPQDDERMNDLAGAINRMEINVAYLTPSVAGILNPEDVPGLTTLALGGEAVRAENVATWADKLHLVNIYGPAEASVWSTGLGPVPKGTSPANIGFGLGALMWITEMGNSDKLCAVGCAGELLIEGPIVARGYLKDKEKTDAAFISDPAWLPLDEKKGTRRLYRTGDGARYNSDGTVSFIGRKDFQIKLHGQRIEMGEIEHNILSHSSVANAVVIYPRSGKVKERLVAVVALRELPSSNGKDEIMFVDTSSNVAAAQQIASSRNHLSERVPGYMMPSVWLAVEFIPLSVNGKTDRSRLIKWVEGLETIQEAISSSTTTEEIVKPATQAEENIQGVLSAVLGIPAQTISMDQSFLGIGGDSITAMQVSARCRSSAMLVTVKSILLSKRIQQIAASAKVAPNITTVQRSADTKAFALLSDSQLVQLEKELKAMGLSGLGDIEDAYPTSHMQQGILISQAQASGNYKFYVICEVTALDASQLNVDRVRKAWQRVVNRHTILRTVFVEGSSGGGLFDSVVLKQATARVSTVDTFDDLVVYPDKNPIDYEEKKPPHRLTLCKADGKVFFNLEVSHTLIDGASMAIILRDMAAAYSKDLPIGPLYRDYISILQEVSPEESLAYWTSYLAGSEPTLFPSLNESPASRKTLEVAQVKLPNAIAHKLQDYSRQNSVTLANCLQMAWALVVRAFSGTTDVLFGFLASGRDIPMEGVEEAVGAFINMLVCRVDADNEAKVVDSIKKIQNDYLDGLPHQHTPLGQVQHACNFSGSMFNTILSLQRPMSEVVQAGSDINIDYLQGHDPTEYDLSVNITASDKVLEISISYWNTFLTRSQAEAVAATFSKALSEMLDKPLERIAGIDLLNDNDKSTIMRLNNNGVALPSVEELIHRNFSKRAKERPDAPAIAAWDGALTFRELDTASNRLAHHLVELGVTLESKVALCFDKSKWTIVSMLAILKAGGAYVSMDPSHPAQHLANIVRETEAKLILTGSDHYTEKLEKIADDVLIVNPVLLYGLLEVSKLPYVHVSPDNAAFVCFTSGSTGKPKSACLTHRGFTSMVANNKDMGITWDSRVFQFSAYTFDTSNSEIFTTLTSGGCVCIPSEAERINDTAGAMGRLGVNWTFMTPSMAGLLSPEDVPTLKTLALGGEQVRDDIVAKWKHDARVINSYGPMECTIWTSMAVLGQGNSPATIGRGKGALLWITDPSDDQRLAPIGCTGELLIEGPILARGYTDPEKTAQAFISAPKWRGAGFEKIRMYKSGDLVRYTKNGDLIYVGRKDGQVKLNGQRIEMSEIEKHIAGHNLMRYAVVLMPKTGICRRKLVAVVAPSEFSTKTAESLEARTIANREDRDKAAAQVAEVREQLRSQVPGYMVPSVWLIAESFPLTASKKVDRVRVLRWVEELSNDTYNDSLDSQEEQSSEENATKEEAQLQRIIATVLNMPKEQVSLNKSFLNAGGDSILAMQLITQCRKQGIKLTVKDVLRSKTISALALTAQSTESDSLTQEELYDVAFKLSPIQSMYFSEITQGSTRSEQNQFNQSFLLNVQRKQDIDKLAKAVDQIVQRHSMLRARYTKDANGIWSQMVLLKTVGSYRLRIHEAESRSEALMMAEGAQQELDIQNGPVFAAEFFNVAEDGQILFLVAHHLVIDLVSWRTLIQELEEALTSDAAPPSARPFPFHSWIKAQNEYAQQNLDPTVALPYNVPVGDYTYWGMKTQPNLRRDTEEASFVLDQTATELLLRGCHESLKTEPLDIFLAAAFQSFARTFQRSPPAIFNEGHGREPWEPQIDVNETVGWFTTMFPFYVSVESNSGLLDTVRQMKDQRKQLPHNGWSYFNSRYSNDAGKEAFSKHSPIEILFNYLGVYQGKQQGGGLLRPEPFNKGDVGPQVRRFSLFDINAYVLDGKAHFSMTYSKKMKHQGDIKRWAESYETTLLEMGRALQCATRTVTLGDFPLLPTTDFDSLSKFQSDTLTSIGAQVDDIEDMFATSPMQEGILLSQNRDKGAYQIQTIVEVLSESKYVIDVAKLAKAWQQVVDRHATLRTIFVQRLSERPFDQVVLKHYEASLSLLEGSDDNAVTRLRDSDNLDYTAAKPSHHVTLLKTRSGRVFCKLEISHALVDGSSMGVMISELALAYLGKLPSEAGPLYRDYIAYIMSQPKHKALEYWTKTLSDVRQCHFPMLTDNETHPQKSLRNVDVAVPSPARIRDFCQQNNITLASIFRLAWGIVLRAYTGDDQVCFGYLASGREIPIAGIDNAIGAFINMLVCSIDFNSFNKKMAVDGLGDLQEDYLKSLPWQHTSLAEIQHALGLAGQTLFNTVLSFQRRSTGDFQVGDILLRYLDGVDPTEYDISVSIADSEEGIHVHMSYFTSQLAHGQALNVANTLSTVLNSILETPQSKIEALTLFGKADEVQVTKWNANCPPLINRCVHEIFHENANKTPDAPAIVGWDGDYTYAELDTKTSQLAHRLVERGVKIDQLVPICFEKSAWALIAMLAIMKAGAGYVPLDPTSPDSRLESINSQLDSNIILASESNAKRMERYSATVVAVSAFSEVWSSKKTTAPAVDVNPSHIAYTLFTSGTTGLPKGVVLPHSAVSSSIIHHGALIGCSDKTRMYQFAAYTFDACILEIYTALAYGGCICVPSDTERLSDIAGFIERTKANTSFMTPSVVRILSPEQIPSMTTLILGGEALGSDNIAMWADETRLMNGYGPTETCVFCVMKTFESPKDRNDILGFAVSSLSWIVRPDNHNELAPVGSVGMLMVEGPTLARGYLNDPVKTSSVFIDNPGFLPPGSRVYNTGDLARYNSDGSITYLGRRDTQVKLRGQRIELAEIEHHTKANFAAAAQVGVEVVIPQGQKERATLAAFLCLVNPPRDSQMFLSPTDDMRDQVLSLQKTLTKLLPPYEIPSLYIPVSKMPTTTAGKLDRKALRDAVAGLSDEELNVFSLSHGGKRALTSDMEKLLAAQWAQVLKISASQIGADDNFFRAGGDSVAAMRLAAKSSAGISLSVSDIFKNPTLAEMAVVAEQNGGPTLSTDIEPFELLKRQVSPADVQTELAAKCEVSPDQIEDGYPCTPLQEGLMVLSILNPGAYMAQKVFRLPNSMDLRRFKEAWQRTAESNPILRTTIVQTDAAQTFQVIVKTKFDWRTAKSVEAYMTKDREEEVSYGKPLSRYAITEDRHFIWTAHHSMYDGWSVPLILEQVRSFYLEGVAATAPGFNSFIKYIMATDESDSRTFWANYLSGDRPVAFPEPPSASHKINVNREAHHSILVVRQKGSDIPMATILRAAWAYVLGQYADSKDVVFGVTLSGRNCPVLEVDKIIGPTITTVPAKVHLPDSGSVADFLQSIQGQATEMMPHEHYGLQNISRVSDEAAKAVEFQNIFVIQPMSQFDVHHNELLGGEEVPLALKNFDTYPLIMECSLDATEVHFEARFDSAVLSTDRIERMLRHFEHVIHQLNDASDATKMEAISMFSEEDMAQIQHWNAQYPEGLETSVPEVFAQQVKARPDALAVDAHDGKFTYAELDELSTRLAFRLIDEGVGPEVLVPMCFEKSRWAIATQMAVIKAGGGVVNLDPAHPLSRLESILEEARATILLVAPQFYDKFKDVQGMKALPVTPEIFDKLKSHTAKAKLFPKISPSSVSYVLFTSGSTGRPKGIVIEHGSLCTSSKAHGTRWDIGPNTRLLQFAAYTFDVSCADIFTTLQRGGCICVPSENDRLNDLAGSINKFQANWMFVTPTVASLLPANGIPSLKKLVLGGEASTRDTIAKWHNVLDLIVCYGPAECSVYCSGAPPAKQDSDPADLGPAIGALYWITDPNDFNRLVPIGCAGELLLEGRTVARGYLHDPVKTASAFVSDPSWAKESTAGTPRRFYRTGDLVRYNADGTIHFVGRKDLQVKVRGQRVELGEIEHSIRSLMPSLAHVTVDAVKQVNQGNRQAVVAFLHTTITNGPAKASTMNDKLKAEMSLLQRALSEHLPSYMIPSLFIPMAQVPLTMNGKSDRKQLRDLAANLTREQSLEYGLEDSIKQEPTTDMEFKLRDLWARILGVDPMSVGTGDHFFKIGGDSILSMKLVGLAAEQGLTLSVKDFFRKPILSDMAAEIDGRSKVLSNGHATPAYQPFSLAKDAHIANAISDIATQIGTSIDNIEDMLPATDFQKNAVGHALMETRGFRNYLFLDGAGANVLDIESAKLAITKVMYEQAILRTVFAIDKDDIVQVVLKNLNVKIETHDVGEDLAGYCEALCKKDVLAPARITEPLLKFFLVTHTTSTHHRIIMRISHAQYDGVCLPIIWQSLAAAFNNTTPTTSLPPSTYLSAISHLDTSSSYAYWQTLLQSSQMTNVITHTKPSYRNIYNTHHRRNIAALSLQSHGITYATLLKAAWSLLLSSLASTRDVVFGSVVSGRNLDVPRIDSIVSACLNIVAIRAQLTPNTTNLTLLQDLQDQYTNSLTHEHIGSRTIVRDCTDWPKYTRFSSIVQHQNIEEESSLAMNGTNYKIDFWCPQADEADLAIKTTPLKDNTTEVLLICNDKAINKKTADLLIDGLCDALKFLASKPEAEVGEFLSAKRQKGKQPVLPLLVASSSANGKRSAPTSPLVSPTASGHKRTKSKGSRSETASVSGVPKPGNIRSRIASWEGVGDKNDVKDQMMKAWQEVLRPGNDVKITGDSDFFELGGDLISAAVLASRFDIRISVEEVIDYSGFRELVEVLSRK